MSEARITGHDPRLSEFHSKKPLDDFFIPKAYEDLVPLSYGAFGVVARATINPNGQHKRQLFVDTNEHITQVAVKRIAASVAYKDPYRSKQTYREIVLMKRLHHENLVRMVDLFSSSQEPEGHKDIYIVTEAMDTDLAFLINSPIGCEYELDASQIQYITHQMFKALKYIHSAEVLHRDLKPQNILVHSNLKVQICDFGLARTNQPLEGSATGYVTTMWYRAPEVMLTWQHYTSALDIWSAGCIFAEMHQRLNYNPSKVSDSKHVYALFPADNHVEHLEMILSLLGAPNPGVLDSSSGAILSWVKGKMDEVNQKGVKPLTEQLHILDEKKSSFLLGLLCFDPKSRISAAAALEHPYITTASWRPQPDARDSRDKLVIEFDGTDATGLPGFWETQIEKEITNAKEQLAPTPTATPLQFSPSIIQQLTSSRSPNQQQQQHQHQQQQQQQQQQHHPQQQQHQPQHHQQHQQQHQQHQQQDIIGREQRFQVCQQQILLARTQLLEAIDFTERTQLETLIAELEQEIAVFTRALLLDDAETRLDPDLLSSELHMHSPPLTTLTTPHRDTQMQPLNNAMSGIQIDNDTTMHTTDETKAIRGMSVSSIGFPEAPDGVNARLYSEASMSDHQYHSTAELLKQLGELSDIDNMEIFTEHKDETEALLSSNLG